jgi:pimeloyl-ACP methyl ester carboxylesterase
MGSKIVALFCLVAALAGCSTYTRHGLDQQRAQQVLQELVRQRPVPSVEVEDRILSLDPAHVTDADIRGTLAQAPAPRIINLHGGFFGVHVYMISFVEFLIGMGYPKVSLENPSDDTYTFSCYESSDMVAGMIAWYYEQDGLRPMLIGHSQGGMQVVKILDRFADPDAKIQVWNPLTWAPEGRCDITDPESGKIRPAAGLRFPYASAACAGGLARFLPNQWDMINRLREIPDSVEEFTGFYKHGDLLGGDFLGYGSINEFHSEGSAVVSNRQLPSNYNHSTFPDTRHLLSSPELMNWINQYQPSDEPMAVLSLDRKFDADSDGILWAAEVWYHIKKHWVLELQRKIRAQRAHHAS